MGGACSVERATNQKHSDTSSVIPPASSQLQPGPARKQPQQHRQQPSHVAGQESPPAADFAVDLLRVSTSDVQNTNTNGGASQSAADSHSTTCRAPAEDDDAASRDSDRLQGEALELYAVRIHAFLESPLPDEAPGELADLLAETCTCAACAPGGLAPDTAVGMRSSEDEDEYSVSVNDDTR